MSNGQKIAAVVAAVAVVVGVAGVVIWSSTGTDSEPTTGEMTALNQAWLDFYEDEYGEAATFGAGLYAPEVVYDAAVFEVDRYLKERSPVESDCTQIDNFWTRQFGHSSELALFIAFSVKWFEFDDRWPDLEFRVAEDAMCGHWE